MCRFKTLLFGAMIACFVFSAQAYKPVDSPKTGLSKAAGKNSDPFARGLKHMRRMALDDLLDSARDRDAHFPRIETTADAGKELIDRINKKIRASHSEVRVTRVERDKLGILHVRLMQYHRGFLVVGSDMIVHIGKNNEIFAVSGTLAPVMDIDTTSPVPSNQAQITAEHSVTNGSRASRDSSKMVVFDGKLAYEVLVQGKNNGPELYKCYVDAKSGGLLYKQNQIIPGAPSNTGDHELVSGTRLAGEGGNVVSMTGWHDTGGNYFFYNKDSVWGVFNLNTSDWEQRATNSWGTSDPAAVSLAKNFSIIQNYVSQVDGINSFNNAGMFARANVHEGVSYVNAYWDGADFHFGDGDGVEAGPLTVLDVAAHEYGHAITQYTSNLVYSYESGALNESFSDIHGTLVEFWAEPDGRSSYPNKTVGASDWLCGEDCWLSGVALRDLRNPQRFSQPSYYMGTLWYTGSGDNGGVHYNSGVQNFAFYLLAEGGTGTNDGHPYSITGLGIQHAGEIAMYANMHLLTSGAQYRDTRDAWIMAASLLGYNATTVADVWTACGVLPLVKHLAVSPSSLNFDSVGVGSSDTLVLTLSNNGASSTIVSGLSFSDPWFSAVSVPPFTVPGGGMYALKVVCKPTLYAARSATLTITSNADDNPNISVGLSAAGVAPAGISLAPSSLHTTVLAGDSSLQNILCTNTGNAPLKIRIAKTETDTPSALWTGVQRWSHDRSPETGHDPSALHPLKANSESAIITSPFFDGFEQGNYNNWTPGSGSYVRSVTNATAASGQYSFTQIGGATNHFDGVSATLATPQQPDRISFSIRAQSNNLSHAYFVLCGAGDAEIIWFFMRSSGYLYANANETVPYSANTWYNIRFILNWATATFDFYVNNVLIAPAIPFRNNTPITTIYLYNFHNSQAWWDNINFGGASENNWLSTTVDTATIFSGQSQPVPVWMKSKGLTGGSYFGSLSIAHNAPAAPSPLIAPCTLSVRGIRRLSVSPVSYNFGNVWAGAHASAVFTLKNSGTEATRVDSLIFSNPAFAQIASLPLTVRANDSVRITVGFSPPAIGPLAETMIVKSTAEDNPTLTVNLSGNGTAPPVAQVSPSALTFSLSSTSTPASQISALSNIGGDTLVYSISTAEVSRPAQGSAGLAWLSATPASGVLSPGSLQNLTITVNPAGCAAGQWNGIVRVTSNDPVNPLVTIAVTANVAGCKKLSVDKTNFDFGTIWAGTSKQLSLLLTNSCNDSVTIASLNFMNPAFVTNAVCPFKVPAFGSVSISIGFAPADSGTYSGNLTIQSNAEDNPSITVQMLGKSLLPPRLSISPPSFKETLNFGDSVSRTMTISNPGGDTLSISINPHTISQPQSFEPVIIADSVQKKIQSQASGNPKLNSNDSSGTNVESIPLQNYSSLSNKNVLLLRDNLAWGYNVNVPLLQSLGATITIAASSQMSGINLQQFHCVIFESQQPTSFYTTYQANITKFDTYVRNGGILEYHCATYSSYRIANLSFPGNMTTLTSAALDNTNYAVNRSHPITLGADSILTGTYASHEAFTNLPPNSMILTVNTALQPTTVTYKLGNGLVIVTGMTWEFGYANNWNSGKPLLPNALSYSINSQQNAWLSAAPSTLKVPPQQSLPVSVKFNAINLLKGNYIGELAISHNDPLAQNPFSLPCTLTINSLRRISVSIDTLKFGQHWIGSTTTLPITFLNSGNDSTTITGIFSSNPEFSNSAVLPLVVPPFGSKTINVIFSPSQTGVKNDSLAIVSNANDNPNLVVFLKGSAIVPPIISVNPTSFSEVLNSGDAVVRSLTISNNGQDTLRFQVSDTMLWLSTNITSGTVAPGGSAIVSVSFTSAGFLGGSYSGAVFITHNDPNHASPLVLPCQLVIPVVRHLSVSPDTFNFGAVRLGSQATKAFTLTNSGNAPTQLSALTGSNPAFSCSATLPLTIPAFGAATVSVVFTPAANGPVAGTFTVQSNALENTLTIRLGGQGKLPPHVIVSPQVFNVQTIPGTPVQRTLTLFNTGGDSLHFTASSVVDAFFALQPASSVYDSTHFAPLVKGAIDTRVGKAVSGLHGGPDASGYRWADSDDPNGPVFVWNDIKSTGVMLSTVSGCDDCYQSQALSFVFPFYADTFSTIYVSSNGYVTLGTPSSQYSNYPLPSTSAPVNLIAGLFDDLYPGAGGDIYFKDFGDRAIVQFDNVYPYSGSGAYTFQIVLRKNGTIDYYYYSMTGPLTSATVGIQNKTGTIGLTVVYNASYLKNSLAVEFRKSPAWLTVAPGSGIVLPGDSIHLGLTFDPLRLNGGTYSAKVQIGHDDPAAPNPLAVSCTLSVAGASRLSVSPTTVRFDTLRPGMRDTAYVVLKNSGNQPTTISGITIDNPDFSILGAIPASVAAFDSSRLGILFVPQGPGLDNGTMTIQSNAGDNPTLTVPLSGVTLLPPHIAVSPQTISERLGPGTMVTKTLTVFNTGGDILHFTSAAIDQSSLAAPSPQYDPSHFIAIGHGQPDTRIGYPVTTASGGPDSFGYRWIDSDQSGGPAYVWNDISATGTVISGVTGCGDCYAPVSFAMPFNFYGTTYTSCWITTKGFISFLSGTYQYTNYPLPSASAPGGIICAFWDDLSTAANGQIYMKEDAGRVTFQWNNIHIYGGSGNQYTFQMVLGIDGSISFYYKSMTGTLTGATVGIQNQTATTGLTMAYNTSYIKNNFAVRIARQPVWLSIGTQSGSIAPGSSVPVPVTLNSTQLTQGVYSAVVRFTHDDPSRVSPLDIPVSLLVSPAGGLFCTPLLIGPSTTGSANGATYRLNSLNVETIVSGRVSGTQYILRFN